MNTVRVKEDHEKCKKYEKHCANVTSRLKATLFRRCFVLDSSGYSSEKSTTITCCFSLSVVGRRHGAEAVRKALNLPEALSFLVFVVVVA